MTGEDVKRARELIDQGWKLQQEGKFDEAILCYRDSIRAHQTAEAHVYLGWILAQQGKYEAAIENCTIAIRLDPDYGNPYNDIGACLMSLGREEEARSYLMSAINSKRYRQRHFPHYNLGRIYEREGDWFKARDYYKTALEIEPGYVLAKDAYYRLMALMN